MTTMTVLFCLLSGALNIIIATGNLGVGRDEQDIELVCLDEVGYALDPQLNPSPSFGANCNVENIDICQGTYALTPLAPKHANGLLNVFLHGTHSPAFWHSKFLTLSAKCGFHTLGLEWNSLSWNTQESSDYCDAYYPGDKDCLYDMHKQLLLGGTTTGGVPKYWPVPCPALNGTCEKGPCCEGDYIADNHESGSIVGLIAQAIEKGGREWTRRFLDKHGNIRWDKIVFSGHSQGANMAAFAAIFLTAQHGSVAGLSLISGPKGLSRPPKEGNDLAANRWVYYPEEYFLSPRGKAIGWADLKVKAMASEYESSYDKGKGEMADIWDAMGLLGHQHVLTFRENNDVVTTKPIPKQSRVRAVVSPLQYAESRGITGGAGYHPSTAIDCLTPRSDPYPGDGKSDTPAVYAQNVNPNMGVWGWVLE